jgi:predicted ester cyclase
LRITRAPGHERSVTMSTLTKTTIESQEANKATAARFIQGFNEDDWDAVRAVVAPGFVFHHPVGGTVEAGPEGMVSTWAGFKVLSPDSWHPIPVMIAEGDHVAVLLPTYGQFSGTGEHAPPPTGGRLDYGMVNMVRLEDGKLIEMWFGMDSLVEMQQMGVAPPPTPRPLSTRAEANLATFRRTVREGDNDFDNVAAFDDVVVAVSPPQKHRETRTRRVEIYRFDDDTATLAYMHELITNPSYGGDPRASSDISRAVVLRWIKEVLSGHNVAVMSELVTPNLLIHPTALPGEATYYGNGASVWLGEQWAAFPDLAVTDEFTVASGDIVAVRWTARGTNHGDYMGVPATGKPVEFTGVSMYRVEGGAIAEIWDTRNTLGILHQLNPNIGGHGHHH